MTFVHPLLLGGLALVAIPLLIHLMMRPKPKRLPFPAFRFLLQKHRSNQTRLRLRHLLLLLLRMAVVAALCLALVRPALTGGVLSPFREDRPVAAVLLIDTSYSMEYNSGGKSRLDEARRRAAELLDTLPDGSKVAVLDSGDAGGEWLLSAAQARDRIAGLKLRHVNAPLTRQIEQAYRLFAELDRMQENPAEIPPQVLYVFSDRTRGCWDEAAAKALTHPAGVSAAFVDVGVDDPADLAIVEVKADSPTVRPGETVRINITVQATGADYEAQLECVIDDKRPGQQRSLKLAAGHAQVVTFEAPTAGPAGTGEAQNGLAEGLHQVEVSLLNSDALLFDNRGFLTFRVLEGQRVLVLADDLPAAERWKAVIAYSGRADVKAVSEAHTVKFDDYAVACLFNVARPDAALWSRLKDYVAGGGGLLLVLGGEKGGPDPAAYGGKDADQLLPARPGKVRSVTDEKERFWAELLGDGQQLARHSLLAPFRRWKGDPNIDYFTDEGRPRVSKFWQVTPADGADVLTHYTDEASSPALLERAVGRGHALLLTTALDPESKEWNQYFGSRSFGFVLSNLIVGYLAGDTQAPALNFVAGQAVPVALPARFLPTYTLAGPGVVGSDATLTRQPEQRELRVIHAMTPGSFTVLEVPDRQSGARRVAAFSINPRPDEYQLARLPVEQIEALLGEGSVVPVGRTGSLRDRLQQRWAQPLDLAPWLLIGLLLFLAVESLLANRFYRTQARARDNQSIGAGSETSAPPERPSQVAEVGA
jgi:hypothetical protein